MSVDFIINAEPRSEQGKGASRRLRRTGRVPAVIYGAGREPELLSVEQRELLKLLTNDAFYSHMLTVKIGERAESAVLRDLQRHPFKPTIVHLDLQRVEAGSTINVHVPLHFINQENAPGVKDQGGVVNHHMVEIEISCLPDAIPDFIEVDIGALGLGQALHLSELVLPAGCSVYALSHGTHQDQAVVSIHAVRGAAEGESDVEGSSEGAASAE